MTNISPWRLNLLRAGYLLLIVGLGLQVWPAIIHGVADQELMEGAVTCMLGSLSLLAVLGLRYPLQMLPILFWELVWKTLWLVRVGQPLWSTNRMDAGHASTAFACMFAVVFLIVIPWPYVFDNYVRKPGDLWWGRGRAAPSPTLASRADRLAELHPERAEVVALTDRDTFRPEDVVGGRRVKIEIGQRE